MMTTWITHFQTTRQSTTAEFWCGGASCRSARSCKLGTIVLCVRAYAVYNTPQKTSLLWRSQPMDSLNLWEAILNPESAPGSFGPRTEIIHQVTNKWTQPPYGPIASHSSPRPACLRVGHMKFIAASAFGPGDATLTAWPARALSPVPFGRSNGTRDAYAIEKKNQLGHCRAPHGHNPAIYGSCIGGCLFNVTDDISESVNLINHSAYAHVVKELTQKLVEAASSGPAWAWPIDGKTASNLIADSCRVAAAGNGIIEPLLVHAPPPAPPAPWEPCQMAMEVGCPCKRFMPDKLQQCLSCGHGVCNVSKYVQSYCTNWPCKIK